MMALFLENNPFNQNKITNTNVIEVQTPNDLNIINSNLLSEQMKSKIIQSLILIFANEKEIKRLYTEGTYDLKNYYLINKKGRACKYTHGSFHCYSKFQGIKIDKGGNYFKEEKICNDKFTCEACKNITELMLHYLPSNVIKKLLERDLQSSRTRKNRK
jgi:hypothetical protein